MNAWDNYAARIAAIGGTKRGSTLLREKRTLTNKLPESLSYHAVTVYDKDHGYNIDRPEIAAGAFQQNVAIINSDNLNEKYIFSLPDEDIRHGDLIHWMGNYWLVTERDANTTVYTKCKMIQCNHLLKWVSDEHKVCEQWCIIEDGTKLRHTRQMCHSLAYWKRYVKTTPLIAGTPLELYRLQSTDEICCSLNAKNDVDWAISSRAANSGRFNDYPGSGRRSKRFGIGSPKPHMRHGEDIVCAPWKSWRCA